MRNRDRMITTDMSARILSSLIKKGWSVARIARTIDAPVDFIDGVQAKRHVLTVKDIEALAERVGTSPNLMILDSIHPVRPNVRPLFDSVRRLLTLTSSPIPSVQNKPGKKRRTRTKRAA